MRPLAVAGKPALAGTDRTTAELPASPGPSAGSEFIRAAAETSGVTTATETSAAEAAARRRAG